MADAPPAVGVPVDLDVLAIDDVLAGDTAAYAGIVGRHERHLRRLVGGIVSDPELAEDVLQDVWLLAYRRLTSLRHRAGFRSWIARIAVREGVRARSRRSRWVSCSFAPLELGGPAEPETSAPGPSEVASDRDEALARLAELAPKERVAFALTAIGWSYAEVAALLGSPMGSVASWVHRARRKLAV